MNAGNSSSGWLRALPHRASKRNRPQGRLDLIGLDMAPYRAETRNSTLVPLIAAVMIGSLLLVGLRMDVVRMRYAAAQAVGLENQLLEEKRAMTVDLLRLREPTLLTAHARKLGFDTPEHVIHLQAGSKADLEAGPRP